MTEGFEQQPATKKDLADVKEELVGRIDRLEEKVDTNIQRLEEKMEKGFASLREILTGPNGLVERMDHVERRVGGYR